MPEYDVVGVGLNATDTLLIVPHFPAYAGKVPFEEEIVSPGGQVASAMVACASLGLRVKYIGSIGDDERGRIQMRKPARHRHQSRSRAASPELPQSIGLHHHRSRHRRTHRAVAARRLPAHRSRPDRARTDHLRPHVVYRRA
jgi:hypothetical protein